MTRFISQDSVAAAATEIVKTAETSIDITGAWITGSAIRLLLQSIRPKIELGQLNLRIVCRLHGLTDLDITDLGAIKEYEQLGAQVRFSRRLHTKMVLVDGKHGLVSSSNPPRCRALIRPQLSRSPTASTRCEPAIAASICMRSPGALSSSALTFRSFRASTSWTPALSETGRRNRWYTPVPPSFASCTASAARLLISSAALAAVRGRGATASGR
jgi:phosphatidylserine/phosphatidylglycerophosphate/cardiolipin synthase-like enzyme